ALVDKHEGKHPALAAIRPDVAGATQLLNERWQTYQAAAVAQDKEIAERDEATVTLRSWVQCWRPVVLLKVPGAQSNLRALPAAGATPDDQVRVAEDLRSFIQNNP